MPEKGSETGLHAARAAQAARLLGLLLLALAPWIGGSTGYVLLMVALALAIASIVDVISRGPPRQAEGEAQEPGDNLP